MKSSNTIATVIVVGAALVAAYAVGLLIRQARVGSSPSSPPVAKDVNEARIREETAKLAHEPGSGRTQDSQQARAELKKKRAETLQKMESATEEQKEQAREKIRERVSADPNAKASKRRPVRRTEPVPPPVAQDPNAQAPDEKTGSDPNSR